MTKILERGKNFSIAIFPFLKTSAPVQIGSYTFRFTDDRAGLSEDEESAVDEIADMLFAKDDFRPPREWSMAKHGLSKAKGPSSPSCSASASSGPGRRNV